MKQQYNIIDDLLRHLSFEEYEYAKSQFVKMCELSGIKKKSIAFFGSVSFPGISDIDVLVVASNKKLRKLNSIFKETCKFSSVFSYMFWHPPLYVLEDVVDDTKLLHTLANLSPIEDNSYLSYKFESISENERNLLNIVWFSFLTKIFSVLTFKLQKGEKINLRYLLLLYKNIFYSYELFNRGFTTETKFFSSRNLIQMILRNKNRPYKFVVDQLERLFKSTAKLFDIYCYEKLETYLSGFNKSKIILTKSIFLFSSKNTRVRIRQPFIFIETNPFVFQLAKDLIYFSCANEKYRKFIDKTHISVDRYHNAHIRYPFVTPFGITVGSPMFFLSRLLDPLLGYVLK